MPPFEALFVILSAVATAAIAVGLWAVLRRSRPSPAAESLGRGRFEEALAAAETGPGAPRDELFTAAVAARHRLRFDLARELLLRVLRMDPDDGEAWLERGLVESYGGDPAAAEEAFLRAGARRSDLAESLQLHRAWLALSRGDRAAARRLFEEIEAPLENKLRTDLGGGEPLFAEWFLQAAALWAAAGDSGRAAWARREGVAAAPESRLPEIAVPVPPDPASRLQ